MKRSSHITRAENQFSTPTIKSNASIDRKVLLMDSQPYVSTVNTSMLNKLTKGLDRIFSILTLAGPVYDSQARSSIRFQVQYQYVGYTYTKDCSEFSVFLISIVLFGIVKGVFQ